MKSFYTDSDLILILNMNMQIFKKLKVAEKIAILLIYDRRKYSRSNNQLKTILLMILISNNWLS